jgi:serralysin
VPAITPTAPTSDPRVNGLLWKDKWATSSLTFGFPIFTSQFTGYTFGQEPYKNFAPLDPVQQALVRSIYGWISSFANLTFTEVDTATAGQADLRFGMSDSPSTAWAYLPDTDLQAGDSWYNRGGGRFAQPVSGTYGYVGFIHEIGHTLGLKHPHETEGTGVITPAAYDSVEFTVMSYHSYPGSGLAGYSNGIYSYPQSYMMLDIAALQHLYGANFTASAGDDVYAWNPDTGQFFIDGAGQAMPGFNRVFQTLWDGGGRDTYDFSLYATALSIDLRPGEWTNTSAAQLANLGGGHFARGNIANALLFEGDPRSLIENVVAGSAADTIIGNVADNLIDGGLGADSMTGGAGSDVYIVDNEADLVIELAGEGNDEIRTGLANLSLVAFANVEKLAATSDLAHDFRGNGGDNVVTGAGGNDFLRLQDGGIDSVQSGAGNDVILFGATLTSADSVDGGIGIDQIAIQGDYAGGLTLGVGIVSVESFAILPGSDARFGDSAGNFYSYNLTTIDQNVAAGVQMVIDANRLRLGEDFTFNGSAESDGRFFVYGGGGTDTLLGGLGNDTFYFGEANQFGAADHVDGGAAGTDQLGLRGNYTIIFGATQLVSIESIGMVSAQDTRFGALGSAYNYNLTMNDGNLAAGVRMTVDAAPLRGAETLTFDGSAELDGSFRIFGGTGADTISGSQNGDLITGGTGADSLRGGGGADIFVYRTAADSSAGNADHILDFTGGGDRIDLSSIDADSAAAGDQAFHFIGSDAFSGTAGELRAVFDSADNVWAVSADSDGDGLADLFILVTTTGPDPLASGDFSL